MNILLIEDDEVLADGLTYTLAKIGYSITGATTATYAEHLLKVQGFNLIILDLGLPDRDGLQLLKQLRRKKLELPILILTARDDMSVRIEGISQGADDYMTKPFDLRELEARIQALIRRCYGGFRHIIKIGQLELDTNNDQIIVRGEMVSLPAREYAVLEVLMLQKGLVMSKDKIAKYLSLKGDALADNAIEIYISRLRKRIEKYGVGIRTFRGLGYLLEEKLDENN